MANDNARHQRQAAQIIGKVYWRQFVSEATPGPTGARTRESVAQSAEDSVREYTRLGMVVLRQLERLGYTVGKSAVAPQAAGARPRPERTRVG